MSLSIIIAAALVSVPFIPLIWRPVAALKLSNRLLAIAESIDRESSRRGLGDHPCVTDLRNLAMWYAAAVPLIASDLLRPSKQAMSDEEIRAAEAYREKVLEFLGANAWMHSYIAGIHACVAVSRGFAQPWNPKLLGPGFIWGVVLRISGEKGGGVRVQLDVTETAVNISDLKSASERVDPKDFTRLTSRLA